MYFSVCVHLYLGLGKNCLVARRDFLSSKTVYCEDIMGITHFKTKLHVSRFGSLTSSFARSLYRKPLIKTKLFRLLFQRFRTTIEKSQ